MNETAAKRFTQLGRTGTQRRLPGKGYSKFVRFMRLALPLVAIGIIGLLLSWPRVEDTIKAVPKETLVPQTVGKNELVNPRFESTDGKSQPFTITAKRAVQSARDPSVILLETPMADILMNDGAWMAAESEHGAYRQDSERLLLEGKVKLFHDRGYEMKTEKLLVNLKDREAWSDMPVYGQGPAGTLEATGMKAESGSSQLIFTGPVRLVLNRSITGIE
ncbi:MAG: LPS export ABC transporter periplasmic protein LptC [Rhodospirillales bacterium]|nr:LPS export ABC transporter periplasmic protein LptC [Rhodospirillales bacterium]MCB9996118.1 LPS export ABC transporter periplasmic protein LptC [Rhodospirillales bacterium]